MNNSANLQLPYMSSGQAQKHITVNESLRKLDAIVQLSVVSATTTAQPGSPSDGDCYILPSGKTGAAWGPMANEAVAYYRDGAWEAITPREGWLAWAKDTDLMLAHDGSSWSTSGVRSALGLGTAALKDLGVSGDTVAQPNGNNQWGAEQDFTFASNHGARFANPYWAWRKADGTRLGFVQYYDAGSANITLEGGGALLMNGNAVYQANAPAIPAIDNAYDLGSASYRNRVVYAGTGSINTSDAREKTALRAFTDAERRAVRRIVAGLGVFQWRDAVAAKGEEGARLHAGVTAQDVAAAFAAEGLDAARYALFCADPLFETVEVSPARVERRTVEIDGVEREIEDMIPAVREQRAIIDPDTGEQRLRLGLRYDQLFAMAFGAMQR
ncbi:MAG: DUF2793 domain-containing protein [Hyphomonadaceae bacterium]